MFVYGNVALPARSLSGAPARRRSCRSSKSRRSQRFGSLSLTGSGSLPRSRHICEVFEPDLVLEMVLVEQRPLDDVEVARGGTVEALAGRRRRARVAREARRPAATPPTAAARGGRRASSIRSSASPSSGLASSRRSSPTIARPKSTGSTASRSSPSCRRRSRRARSSPRCAGRPRGPRCSSSRSVRPGRAAPIVRARFPAARTGAGTPPGSARARSRGRGGRRASRRRA